MKPGSIAIVGAAETTELGKIPDLAQIQLHADAAINAMNDALTGTPPTTTSSTTSEATSSASSGTTTTTNGGGMPDYDGETTCTGTQSLIPG